MSKIEEKVIDQIRERAKKGKTKYGTTMDRNDLSLTEWLQHLQEELLDAAVYAEKLKQEVQYQEFLVKNNFEVATDEEYELFRQSQSDQWLEDEAQEQRMRHIGQNGNDGLHYAPEKDKINYPQARYHESEIEGDRNDRTTWENPGGSYWENQLDPDVAEHNHNVEREKQAQEEFAKEDKLKAMTITVEGLNFKYNGE